MERTVEGHEYFVRVPLVTESTLTAPEGALVPRPELKAPAANRFVGDDDPAFSEEILDVPKAHAESVVEPDGMTNDFGRKSVTTVSRFRIAHSHGVPNARAR